LDRSRFRPLVVFHADNCLRPRFHDLGVETVVWPRVRTATFGGRLGAACPPLGRPALLLQKAVNFLRGFLWHVVAQAVFLRRVGARILHLNNSILHSNDWMMAARLARVRCVTHERGINDDYPPPARYWASRIDAIVCISEAVRHQLESHGVDYGNLVTIHNGFDPAEARFETPPTALRAAHGIAEGAPVVVMCGNLKAWKGQETVVRAMATVVRARPDARCLLVGATAPSDRGFEDEMRSLIAALALQEHVLLVGFKENVLGYMRMADVVVHASTLPEPFGRVALEAMACHRPVIGADAGGMPEIVQDGVTGLTFPPGDADRLASAIVWMIDHPAEASQMGERGFARLRDRFPISRNVRATELLYERLLGGNRAIVGRLPLVKEDANVS
jgi:glycosyltransferase involved in cell wall biosynthesis